MDTRVKPAHDVVKRRFRVDNTTCARKTMPMTTDDSLPELIIDAETGCALPVTEAEQTLLLQVKHGEDTVISTGIDVNDPNAWAFEQTIRGDFLRHICLRPKLYNDNPCWIFISGARISGELILIKSKLSQALGFLDCHFDRAPRLAGTNIPALEFVACYIPSFWANELTVKEQFLWHSPIEPAGYFNLNNAHVGELISNLQSWPEVGRLFIDGFTYDRIGRSLSVADHIKWIKLMANERDGKPFFYHQPWEQARKVYRDEGDANAVRQVNMAYDAAKARFQFETAHGVLKPLVWLRNVLYDKLAGHGHNLFRVVPWMGLCMVVFLAWVSFAYHHGSIVPTASRIYMNTCYLDLTKTDCAGWELHPRAFYVGGAPQPLIDTPPLRIPEGYPAFHSFLYTLDTFIPFADLHQENYWTVTDDGPWGEWMRAIFSVFIGLGGVLSAIFAAGMFSLIRKN